MPISSFLNGERFDPETRRILGVAFELTCVALRTGGLLHWIIRRTALDDKTSFDRLRRHAG